MCFKKITALLICASLMLPTASFAVGANNTIDADDSTDRTVVEQNIREKIKTDEQFNSFVEAEGTKLGEEFIQRKIEREMRRNLKNKLLNLKLDNNNKSSYGDFYASVSMPCIEQSKSYYCGPATVLQTMYALDLEDDIDGRDDDDKQDTLADDMDTNKWGTIVWKLTKYGLNDNVKHRPYEYNDIGNESEKQFRKFVYNSLDDDYPCIIHSKTKYLDYYGGRNIGHYISVCAIDYKDYEMKLVDTNQDEEYQGKHWVDIGAVYKTLHKYDRFLINA